MLKDKKGTSIISLVLCAVAISLVTTALVVATNNAAVYRAQKMTYNNTKVVETSAYKDTDRVENVRKIANQAFVNNYLSFYDKQVDLEGFKALVIGEMMQTIPQNELEDYTIDITADGVSVSER